MKVARHSKRLLAALMASAITVVDVQAAVTDIYSQPLATTSTVVAKPNIMFVLDNSGSMSWSYMPDEMSNNGRYGYWSPQCNGIAYDPSAAVSYPPPVKVDGTPFPDANFNAAAPDGYTYVGGSANSTTTTLTVATGSVTVKVPGAGISTYATGNAVAITSAADPTVWLSGNVTSWNGTTNDLAVNVTAVGGSGSGNSWTVSVVSNLNGSTYYNYTGTQPKLNWTYDTSGNTQTGTPFYTECQSNIGSSPGSGVFTVGTVTNASPAAEKQKYANWYAYYRTRRLMARTAIGRAFQAMDSRFRVGFTTISDRGATEGTNWFLDIADFTTTRKNNFYSSLYTADGNSSTPLRASLSKVGRYFANKAPGQASDPMQYSCQRNYTILTTDGYWNTGSETASYGPFQLTSNTNVGQQDGTETKPMHDGANAVSTTTTTTTTVQRQQVVTTNRASTNYRRYRWSIGTTPGTCGTGNYTQSEQQQNRSATADSTTTLVRDATTTLTRTIVTTNGVVTSDNNPGVTTGPSYATVSTNTVAGATSDGTFANTGGATSGCATASGLQLPNPDLVPGQTYWSTTNDANCMTTCNYNATSGASTAGGAATGTTNSVLSGPAVTTIGAPTVTSASNTVNSTSGGSSNSLADVAEYYYANDLRTSALNNCTGAPDAAGNTHDVCSNGTMLPMPPLDIATHQHMTTFTVGMGLNGTLAYDPNYLNQASGTYVNLKNGTANWPDPGAGGDDARAIDDLWHAAVNGRGRYFATNNANTLANALQNALTDVTKAYGSAAGAATNSLEPVLGDNNNAYVATYTTVEWTGDIRAHPLDAATGAINTATTVWSAKTQLEGVSAGSRNIKYMNPVTKALRAFNYGNLSTDGYGGNFTNLCSKTPTPLQCGTLTSGQVTLANDGTNLVNFLRGD
ncbi:MAG TPA: hypothetical protein VFZ28_19680, partial [Burkholderiaceae bacterium]|nr:hypothetical protein [Burkholderiaceae bacterium]